MFSGRTHITTMPATLTPQALVAKWRKAALKERAASKEHFLDLYRLLAHPTPADVDAKGTRFTFEYGAAELGGGNGFADVFKWPAHPSAGSGPGPTDDEILARLLALNRTRAGGAS